MTAAEAARAQVLTGGVVLAVLGAAALLAPVLAPYDPRLPVARPFLPPGPAHPLGTNDVGQDLLSLCLWAGRWTVLVALGVTAISTVLSWAVGVASGLWSGLSAPLSMLADVLLALPSLPLALLVLTLAGPSLASVVVTLGLLSWPGFARIVHARVLGLRGRQHVLAARALGATEGRVAARHVVPGTVELLPAKVVLTVRYAVFAEATLAFLGLGDPSAPSWGGMLGWAFNDPLLFARPGWGWLVGPPAALIGLTVLATTALATGLEEGGARPRPRPNDRQPIHAARASDATAAPSRRPEDSLA